MPRTETKPKSVRRPLRDLSNTNKNGGGRLSKSVNAKENSYEKQIEEASDDGALDRLLLVQSDLSSLLQQIDELVAQAFKVKTTSKQGKKEIQSFTHVLSGMISTLKPWVPRFQKVLFSSVEFEDQLEQSLASKTVSTVNEEENCEFESPEENKEDTLVSPSPLVSWRANCTIERGRQLFLLTPLPMSKALSSKHQDPSKSIFRKITSNTIELPPFLTISGDANDDLLEGVAIKPTPSKPSESLVAGKGNTQESGFVSSPMFSKRDHSILVMTPCLKMSPPKSCVLLEPISESTHQTRDGVRKSTPFPVGIRNCEGSQSSESSDSEASEDLAFKYPELLGIQRACKSGIARKGLEASPDWLFSPPKSCVLLEPPNETLENVPADQSLPITSASNPLMSLSLFKDKENDVQSSCQQTRKWCNPEPAQVNAALVESTPLRKEPESTLRTGKRPGETTLKKELWTRFEAASSFGIHYNASAIQRTAKKNFLDMLEEEAS